MNNNRKRNVINYKFKISEIIQTILKLNAKKIETIKNEYH
jgi:hypothetical protein